MAPKFIFGAALLSLVFACEKSIAAPFIPASEKEIVETLPAGTQQARRSLSGSNELLKSSAPLKQGNAESAQNIEARIVEARGFIELARTEGDPRSLGYAESLLQPLVTSDTPNAKALVMYAIALQSRHDFRGAEKALETALKIHPGDAQAWLTKAMILRAQGRIDEARKSCAPLLRTADEFTLTLCAVSVRSLSGHAREAYQVLEGALQAQQESSKSSLVWAQTLLAEIAEQLGDNQAAARHYSQAIVLEKKDPYLLAAYSDFFLRQGKPRAVLALLQGRGLEKQDGLLLRLALAAKAAGEIEEFAAYSSELWSRIEAARLRGDSIHLREEAIAELELRGDASRALALAKRNFENQRELADAQILLKSAQLANDAGGAQMVRQWLAANKVEDVRLQNFVGSEL